MGCLRLSYYETENESEKTEVSPLRMVWKNPKPGKIKKGKIFSFIGKKIQSSPETRSEKKETSIFSFIGKKEVTLKKYEKVNHLGNVGVVISDRKVAVATTLNGNVFDHWKADVLSAQDYYPFGSLMPGRNFSSNSYRFGFNGYEMDNEMRGKVGADYDFDGYGLDVLLGRRKSPDPMFKGYPYLSPYAVFQNNPLYFIDKNGEFTIDVHKKITEQALLRANLPITKVDEDDVYGSKTNSVIHGVQRADILGFARDLHFDRRSTFEEINKTWSKLGEKIANTDYSFNNGGLGVALHTVQDFYSHSNYVELYIDYFKSKGGDISKLKPGDIPIYDEKTKDSDFGKHLAGLDKQIGLKTGEFNFFRWIVGMDKKHAEKQGKIHHDVLAKDSPDKGKGSEKVEGSESTYHDFAREVATQHSTEILKEKATPPKK